MYSAKACEFSYMPQCQDFSRLSAGLSVCPIHLSVPPLMGADQAHRVSNSKDNT